ncbi:MAG TPA: hypothetical protein PK611_04395 [Saprospiraceae bacterium]|nr:hypothetical protein [Saprospiraceae bacterium]HRO08724.1 hypothetical protein [Saprospiraceae bacterium]HRO72889.1 hypothetical protein [Saprospiraceae bacterium]HRP42035.1 hypothetical protein [Saprospiraceae bacterium]
MQSTFALEETNKNKSRIITIVVHAILLIFAFFYSLPQPVDHSVKEDPSYEINLDVPAFKKIAPVTVVKPKVKEPPLAELGHESSNSRMSSDDEGVMRSKSESAPNEAPMSRNPASTDAVKPQVIDVTKPQVVSPPKVDIKVPGPKVTPANDDVVSSNEDSPVKAPPSTNSSSSGSTTRTPSSGSPASGSGLPGKSPTKGSTTGTSKNPPSSIDGPGGTGKGKTGTGAGMSTGNDGDGGHGNSSDGTGMYDGTGDGVFGRKIIYRNMPAAKAAINQSGKIVMKVCINQAGIVTYVELMNSETTLRDREGLKLYLKAARGYKFQPDITAPKEQCGKMSFTVDNSANNKLRGGK